MNLKKTLGIGLLIAISGQTAYAQAFPKTDYVRALWMATRFYGGQRSGDGPNWLLIGLADKYQKSFTRDAYQGKDISGGWFDCGDHVMFGQTQYWSAYSLAKAFEAFPTGFHDLYNGNDYSDYKASGKWNDYVGGTPNGIPDIIDELIYETDFIAKAAIDENTFVTLKGDGNKDHNRWVTPGMMSLMNASNGGECTSGGEEKYEQNSSGQWVFMGTLSACTGYASRLTKADNDKSMASYGAATLAIMSRLLQQLGIDKTRQDLYRTKAKVAYAVATKASARIPYSPFYGANPNQKDDYVTASIEMYKTFDDDSYLGNATANQDGINKDHNWAYNYNNNDDMAWYNLAESGADQAQGEFYLEKYAEYYKNKVNGEGISAVGDGSWGTNRYPAAGAFVMALANKQLKGTTYDQYIYSNIDYMLGKNNSKQVFLTGFTPSTGSGYKVPLHPHHRSVYQVNTNPDDAGKQAMPIPEKNKSHGSLMGHVGFASSGFNDDVVDYHSTEVCTDYNVGLVGALAYIVSKLAPVGTDLPAYDPNPVLHTKVSTSTFAMHRNGNVYSFSNQAGKEFKLDIVDQKGRRLQSQRSNGSPLQFAPASAGVYMAVVSSGSSTRSFRIFAD